METSAVKKPNPDDFKSNWEFTKVTSNYHFDSNIMDPRWDTIHGLGKFEGDWDNEVNTLIQDAKAISWRTRQFSANADYYTSPMVEQEEYDLKKANMDPNQPMFRIKNLTSFGPMLSKMVNLFCLEETKSKISKSFIVRLPKKENGIEIKEIPLNKKLFNAFIGAKYVMEQMESVEY